jgi:hypothetical protein
MEGQWEGPWASLEGVGIVKRRNCFWHADAGFAKVDSGLLSSSHAG